MSSDGNCISVFEFITCEFIFQISFSLFTSVLQLLIFRVNYVTVLKCKGSWSADTIVALFGIESPAPQQHWTVRDGSGGALFFNPVPQTVAETKQRDDSKVTDLVPSKSKLTFITSGREFVVFDPYQREEEEPEQAVVRDVSVPEEVSSAFSAVYGKAVQPKKSDAPPDVLSALSRAPWGTLLNGPSHVLPSLSVVAIPFMDSLMIKRKEQS